MKLQNIQPGVNLKFEGFRGNRPAKVLFSLEKYSNGVFAVAGLVAVPLTAAPRSEGAAGRARRWARRQILKAMEGGEK